MKRIQSIAAWLLSMLLICPLLTGFFCTPAAAADTQTSENYNETQLSALVRFFQYDIALDKNSKVKNYEYAKLHIDFDKPWEYPGITWSNTAPYSVLSIDFSAYPKLSGKLDVSSMFRLQTINVSGTEIDWVVFGENTELISVHAANAGILSMDLSGCSALETVYCQGSYLQQLIPPEHALKELHCENNYLNFSTLPAVGCAENYSYSPQRNAFFIAQSTANSLEQNTKADMTSYQADTIEWFDKTGKPLSGITEDKPQVYEFEGLELGDEIYAVMTNDAFPELTLTTSSITVIQNSRYVWWMCLGAAFVFFIIFFCIRYMSAKHRGIELTTDKYTDRISDAFDRLIQNIDEKLQKHKKGK